MKLRIKAQETKRRKRELLLLFVPVILPLAFLAARYFPQTVVVAIMAYEKTAAAEQMPEQTMRELATAIGKRPYANTYIVRNVVIINGNGGHGEDIKYNRREGTVSVEYSSNSNWGSGGGNLTYADVTDEKIQTLVHELDRPFSSDGMTFRGHSRLPKYGCKVTVAPTW